MAEVDYTGAQLAFTMTGASGTEFRFQNYDTALPSSPGTAYTYDPQGSVVEPVTLYYTGGPPVIKVRSSSMYDGFGVGYTTTAEGSAGTDPYDSVGFGGQHGYYHDYTTGLYLLGHRYYDAGAGRFVTRDPIGYKGGINLYGFAGNNPVNESDPKGTDAVIFFGGDQKSQNQTWWKAAMAYGKSYEHSHVGQRAHVFSLNNGPNSMVAALNMTQNVDTIMYIGHAGINSQGISNFYTGTVAQNDITSYMVNRLPKQNVRSNPTIFLFGCDTAAKVDPVNGKNLAPGEMSMSQAFANHFHVNVQGFADHVGFGAPFVQGWLHEYDYYATFHNGLHFVHPVTVYPRK